MKQKDSSYEESSHNGKTARTPLRFFTAAEPRETRKEDMGLRAYKHRVTKLTELGYDRIDAKDIVLSKFGNKAADTLIRLHPQLINAVYDKGQKWDHKTLTRIAVSGARHALEGISEYTQQILNSGYSLADISKIARYNGSKLTLEALLSYTKSLVLLGYTLQQICSIAGTKPGGSCRLRELFIHTENLLRLGHSHLDIIRMALGKDGIATLHAASIGTSADQELHVGNTSGLAPSSVFATETGVSSTRDALNSAFQVDNTVGLALSSGFMAEIEIGSNQRALNFGQLNTANQAPEEVSQMSLNSLMYFWSTPVIPSTPPPEEESDLYGIIDRLLGTR